MNRERLEQRARRHQVAEQALAGEAVQRLGDRAELVGELGERVAADLEQVDLGDARDAVTATVRGLIELIATA